MCEQVCDKQPIVDVFRFFRAREFGLDRTDLTRYTRDNAGNILLLFEYSLSSRRNMKAAAHNSCVLSRAHHLSRDCAFGHARRIVFTVLSVRAKGYGGAEVLIQCASIRPANRTSFMSIEIWSTFSKSTLSKSPCLYRTSIYSMQYSLSLSLCWILPRRKRPPRFYIFFPLFILFDCLHYSVVFNGCDSNRYLHRERIKQDNSSIELPSNEELPLRGEAKLSRIRRAFDSSIYLAGPSFLLHVLHGTHRVSRPSFARWHRPRV